MRNNFFKLFIVSFLLMTDFITYSQGTNDNNGDLEGNDPLPTPINGQLIFLVILGITFALYTFRKNKKIA